MTVLFALLAALSNAVNVATQHVASRRAPRSAKGWRLVPYLFTSPLWLLGWVALAGAFVFQAVALHGGQLSVVQPLMVTELVFALVLRRLWVRQDIRPVTWWSAAATVVALALFVAMSEPQGGTAHPSTRAWAGAIAATLGVTAVLVLAGLRGSPGRRAACLGAGAAVSWALVAVFIKTTTETFSDYGLGGMFTHWPVYALAAAGLGAEVLNQAALHVGPLSMSQPFLVIVDPVASIVLSIWVFGEYFSASPGRIVVAALSFVAMCGAVIVLIRTAPQTMERGSGLPAAPPSSEIPPPAAAV